MVRVLLFAQLRDRAGTDVVHVEAGAGATVGEVIAAVVARHPQLGPLRDQLLVAVNRSFVRRHDPVAPGDEVALMPPVSGG